MADQAAKPRLTLYENLLSEQDLAERDAREAAKKAEEAQKKKDASLMFKPSNVGKKNNNNKSAQKSKPAFASSAHQPSSSTSTMAAYTASSPDRLAQHMSSTPDATFRQLSSTPQMPQQQPQKRSYRDWLANEDEEQEIYERERQRKRHPSRKEKKQMAKANTNFSWHDPYDPSVPTPFEQYRGSADYQDMNYAWKEYLFGARDARQGPPPPVPSNSLPPGTSVPSASTFRQGPDYPPPGLNFAPPTSYGSDQGSTSGSMFAPPTDLNMDESADDVFARRLAMSRQQQQPPVPMSSSSQSTPAPVNSSSPPLTYSDIEAKRAKAQAQIAAMKARQAGAKGASPGNAPPTAASLPPPPPADRQSAEPQARPYSSVITGAPTINPEWLAMKAQQEAAEAESAVADVSPDADAPRSKAPGQAGFAERMMKNMGWEKGKGLGASGDGIQTALRVQPEKRKKKPDAQGGGYVSAAKGKIVGGKKTKTADDNGPHGKVSLVVKLEGMLEGMDVQKAIAEEDLLQEIGEEMGKYGMVERLKIWEPRDGGNNEVFVKYTSQVSALEAAKGMDGNEFADNVIKASFWDEDQFETGEYA